MSGYTTSSFGKAGESVESAFARLPLAFQECDESVALENSEQEGYSPVFRNKYSAKRGLIQTVHPELTTVFDYFEYACKKFPDRSCLARRLYDKEGNLENHYTPMRYARVRELRDQFGSGLLKVLQEFDEIDLANFILCLYSANRYEWIVGDLASHAFSIPNVALYDTLGPESSTYILDLTKSPVILLSKDKINTILQLKKDADSLSHLKLLISMEPIDGEKDEALLSLAKLKNLKIYHFDQVLDFGARFPHDHIPPSLEDIFTISFTSGTTSMPKGCCLTHANAVAGVTMAWAHIHPPEYPKSMAFLPLAHVLERFKVVYELSRGAMVAFPHDPAKVLTFLDDIKVLEPTHMCAVPRLYNRIESGIRERIKSEGWFKRKLVTWAINYKVKAVREMNDESLMCQMLNKLIFDKIKEKIGFKNLSFLISGSAPLSEDTIVFLKAIFNCGFNQGYGLTESYAAIAVTSPRDPHPDSCGPIGVGTEFRLRDLPDVDYSYAKNRSGELMLRGPQIFQEYLYNKELTEGAKDKDGWFATGDVAKLTDKGNKLVIIDRAKNFFKLSQGEYVAVEKVENIYLANVTFLNQLFLYGDSFQSYLVAVLNIDPKIFVNFLKKTSEYSNISSIDEVDLDDKALRKLVLNLCNTAIAKSGLFGFEKFKNLKIGVDVFKVEDDVITPTLKIKRPQAKKFFNKEIEQMYDEGML